MATIVDALFFELGLDTTKFDTAQKKSVDQLRKFDEQNSKNNKNAKEGAEKMAQGFNKAKNELVGLAAIVIGFSSFKQFIADVVTGNSALGRTAYFTGMSARELDAWGSSVKSVGGTAEAFVGTVQGIQGALENFSLGQGGEKTVGMLHSLGINAVDAAQHMRPMKDILLDLSDSFSKINDPLKQRALAQQLGIDEGTLNLLRQGRQAVLAQYDSMYKLSGVTDESVAAAQKAQAAFAKLQATFQGIAQSSFTPMLLEFSDWVSTHGDDVNNFFRLLANTMKVLAMATKDLFGWIGPVLNRLSQLHSGTGINKPKDGKMTDRSTAGSLLFGVDESSAAKASSSSNSSLPRGLRNNNPGNVRYGPFAKAHGATGQDDKGFAIFPDIDTGSNAMGALLKSYQKSGIDTISGIISKYAPSSENDTAAYIASVSKGTGIDASKHLTNDQYKSVQNAMALHENGARYGNLKSDNSSKVETSIGSITVNTQATDAGGIAKGLRAALQQNTLITGTVKGAM